jgi:hypothetical protein
MGRWTPPSADEGVTIIGKSSFPVRAFYALLAVCILLFLVSGCHYRGSAEIPAPEGGMVFQRIAVVPFRQVSPEERLGGAVRCPLCGAMFEAGPTAGSPETAVEALFLKQMQQGAPKVGIIAGDRAAGVFRRVSSVSLREPLRKVLREVGSELGAEGVVSGTVYRFRERKGGAYAVDQPASVAFEIHLLRVSDGALVWRGTFDRTQTSLMEDLLQAASFYRGGGRWLTAEELAAEGMEQVLKSFPASP